MSSQIFCDEKNPLGLEIPNGLDDINAMFGQIDVPKYEEKNIVSFTFPYEMRYAGKPVKTGRCHKRLKETFESVFERIRSEGVQDRANDYGGVYAARPIRGALSHPSTHSWGIAIDLEPATNPLGAVRGTMDAQIVLIFEEFGFFWGGRFKSRKDWMHFQFARNY